MKRIISLIISLLILVTLPACNNSANEPEIPQSTNGEVTGPTKDTETTKGTEDEGIRLDITYKVPLKNIYVDAPNYQEIEQAYTELFMVHNEKYFAITAARKSTATDPKDAHEQAFSEFKINMQNYEGGVNAISIVKEENKTINGIDVYYFAGTINYGTDDKYNGYAVGYSFIMDGIPCEIIGSIIGINQSESLEKDVSAIVDAMMKSVRSEK